MIDRQALTLYQILDNIEGIFAKLQLCPIGVNWGHGLSLKKGNGQRISQKDKI